MHGANARMLPWESFTVIEILVLSKLIYVFVNLPDPSDGFMRELDVLLFQFLWDGKPSKIAGKTVCQSYEEEGLGMLDVFPFLSSFKIG